LHNADAVTENCSLDHWSREILIFKGIKRLKFFQKYFFWKFFQIWMKFVLTNRFQAIDTTDSLLQKYLLAIRGEKKYSLHEFEPTTSENIESLKSQFAAFIVSTTRKIVDLYSVVSNPVLVQVKGRELPEVGRRNPNMDQLMTLEYTKATSRMAKMDNGNKEMISVGSFIGMMDYLLVESLSES
jgi:hypothetical protein